MTFLLSVLGVGSLILSQPIEFVWPQSESLCDREAATWVLSSEPDPSHFLMTRSLELDFSQGMPVVGLSESGGFFITRPIIEPNLELWNTAKPGRCDRELIAPTKPALNLRSENDDTAAATQVAPQADPRADTTEQRDKTRDQQISRNPAAATSSCRVPARQSAFGKSTIGCRCSAF